jgi:hypothetical protein
MEMDLNRTAMFLPESVLFESGNDRLPIEFHCIVFLCAGGKVWAVSEMPSGGKNNHRKAMGTLIEGVKTLLSDLLVVQVLNGKKNQ